MLVGLPMRVGKDQTNYIREMMNHSTLQNRLYIGLYLKLYLIYNLCVFHVIVLSKINQQRIFGTAKEAN